MISDIIIYDTSAQMARLTGYGSVKTVCFRNNQYFVIEPLLLTMK